MGHRQVEVDLKSDPPAHHVTLRCLSGLVEVGQTWQCPASVQGEELEHLERSAVLTGLQQKHLTHLSNPRWLKAPLPVPGGRDLWTVDIPAELLP